MEMIAFGYLASVILNIFLFRWRVRRLSAAVEESRQEGYGFFIRCPLHIRAREQGLQDEESVDVFFVSLFSIVYTMVSLGRLWQENCYSHQLRRAAARQRTLC